MCLSIKMRHPDYVLAEGVYCGHEWVVVHNGNGYRCGYIKVPPGHPWHGRDYSDSLWEPDVHGGLTFAEPDTPCDKGGLDDGWWIGFDCAHFGDAQDRTLPNYGPTPWPLFGGGVGAQVRTEEFVEGECRNLCLQAAAAGVTVS